MYKSKPQRVLFTIMSNELRKDGDIVWMNVAKKSLITGAGGAALFLAVNQSFKFAAVAGLAIGIADTLSELIFGALGDSVKLTVAQVDGKPGTDYNPLVQAAIEAALSTAIYIIAAMMKVAPMWGGPLKTAVIIAIADVAGSAAYSLINPYLPAAPTTTAT